MRHRQRNASCTTGSTSSTSSACSYGRPDNDNPVIAPDITDLQRHTVIVTFAGGRKRVVVQMFGLAAGAEAAWRTYQPTLADTRRARRGSCPARRPRNRLAALIDVILSLDLPPELAQQMSTRRRASSAGQ
ncbi:hypothetical protein AB0K00_54005 [Dactylosporangium sp. NPDC049525]|uniref:hypothetical protein n=1 Tax=Dactylosporangium sp. NPDC049525 TaxID=3154730 RepID=UPI00341CF602